MCAAIPAQTAAADSGVQNFVDFGLDRSRISDDDFLRVPSIVGAQLKYTWRELEPAQGPINV